MIRFEPQHKSQTYLILVAAALIAGCSNSESVPPDPQTPDTGLDGSPSVDNTPSVNLFSNELIEPLLADLEPGSPLSVANHPTFLSAYYRVGGSQLMQTITQSMDKVSNELRAALSGEASSFVADSVGGSDVDNTLVANLTCPDGGSVSVTLSTDQSTETVYGEYRDELVYDECNYNGLTYNGKTAELSSIFPQTGVENVSRRFGGFVYSGGSTGSNQFTDHPEGFGEANEQFTIANSSGVTALLYAQQSYTYKDSSRDYPLQRWHGNWRLQKDDRSLTINNMNIRVLNELEPSSLDARTFVEPYFTLTGTVTNGRTITAFNQLSILEMEQIGSLRFGNQNLTDEEGGILDLYFDIEQFQQDGVSTNAIRIDTEGQVLDEALPLTDEMFLVTDILKPL